MVVLGPRPWHPHPALIFVPARRPLLLRPLRLQQSPGSARGLDPVQQLACVLTDRRGAERF